MSIVMLVLGIVVALAGAAALGFGIQINEFSVGHTLMLAGTTGLAGGLVVIGLSAVIGRLGRIAKALETQPASHPDRASVGITEHFQPSEAPLPAPKAAEPPSVAPVPPQPLDIRPAAPAIELRPAPEAHPIEPKSVEPKSIETKSIETKPIEPKPATESNLDVSALAIDRLRSSIARPAKADVVAPTKSDMVVPPRTMMGSEADDLPMEPMPVSPSPPPSGQNGSGHQPKIDVPARNPNSAAEALKNKRLDFLFRSRATRPPPDEQSEPQWPRRSVRDMQNGGQPAAEQPAAASPTPRPEPPRAAAIIKSGVVDGMAYTLYADGSIEAQLPHGTVRFGSITELRSHIENNS